MIRVEKTADTLEQGVANMMAGAKLDYQRWSEKGDVCLLVQKQVAEWDSKTKVSEGKKYIKVKEKRRILFYCKRRL